MFYWGAILFSQTSGKSLGDWMADTTTKAGHSYSPQAWCWSRGIFLYESLAQPNVAARRDPASATLRQRRAAATVHCATPTSILFAAPAPATTTANDAATRRAEAAANRAETATAGENKDAEVMIAEKR
jgi:hypothetical protein